MATAPLTGLVGHVCRSSRDAGLTDGQLLDAFLARRDEAAFECLVWRHGPAVLGACRRILQNDTDAEDAFQATFLVLVRKARAVRPRDAVGAWLYGVACNVARKARADSERRRAKNLALAERPLPQSPDPDLRPVIDFEVERLPEKYRAPIVLCELEEQPIADAAAQLGWPQGTVASRLARARVLLGRRLVRHGIGLSTLVGVTLTSETVAGVLRAVRESGGTSNRLANAVMRSMFVAKVQMATIAVACVVLVLMGGYALRMSAGEKGDASNPGDPPRKAPVKVDSVKPEVNPIVGRWKIVKQVYNGEATEPPGVRRVVVTNQTLQFLGIGLRTTLYTWNVNPSASPPTLDLEDLNVDSRTPEKVNAIYKLDGDSLTIAVHHLPLYGVPGNDKILGWPKDFGGKDVLVLTFERDKAEKADFERLVGRWRVLGNRPYKVIEFLEQPHQGLMIAENAKHEADWFSWTIDERKNPRQIDVSARVEGASIPNRGIYKFDGERLLIYLGAALQFQGDPGKHSRPEAFENDVIPGVNCLVLEREMVAWGKPLDNGLQFGVLAEPNGRAKVEIGDAVEFRLFVRNTTNKAIDVDLLKTDGLPAGWTAIIRDSLGREHKVSEQIPPPNVAISPSWLKLKMVDYQVAELGTVKIRFVDREQGRSAAYPVGCVPVVPGDYSIQFAGRKEWRMDGASGELKLKVEPAIAWGAAKDGIQFGLALAKGQSPKIHIGEHARFRIVARNTSAKDVSFATVPVRHLPAMAEPKVEAKGDIKGLRVLYYIWARLEAAYTLKIPANATVELPGEFELPFLAHRKDGQDTHVVARTGQWTLSIPKLHGWINSPDHGTGGLDIEIVPGEVEHTDGQRIAWGPVAEGLQFGLQPDKDEYTIGDSVKFTVHARNMSDKEETFMFPTLYGYWPNNGRPTIKDADGKDVKPNLAQPPGLIGPQGVKKYTLKTGESAEVTTVGWVFVSVALPGLYKVDHVVLEKPGEYTFQYPDLHAKNKPAWPTGAAKLVFKKPAAVKSDADRLLGHWRIKSEKFNGAAGRDGRYRMFEFRALVNNGPFVAHSELDVEHWFTWKIDATKAPKEIDLSARVPGFSIPHLGVYEWDGERLRIGLGTQLQFTGDPGQHKRPQSLETAAHILELSPIDIAWGAEKDGLQFGLSLGRRQSTTVRVGESVDFLVWVRNNSVKDKTCSALPATSMPYRVIPEVSRDGQTWRSQKSPLPESPMGRKDTAVAPGITRLIAEVSYDFLPGLGSGNNGLEAKPGTWDVQFKDLAPWLGTVGHATGAITIEVKPGDEAHVDKLGVSWGPAVGGLQFGLTHVDASRTEFKYGDTMSARLWVRNYSTDLQDVALQEPKLLWCIGRYPIVTDAKGNKIELEKPGKAPEVSDRELRLRIGERVDWGQIDWPLAEPAPTKERVFALPTIVINPGEYSIHYPDLHRVWKEGATPRPTGKLSFKVK